MQSELHTERSSVCSSDCITCFRAPRAAPAQRYRDTLDQAIHAESLGFESVWPVEHHFNSAASILPCPALSGGRGSHQQIRLGTAIVQLPLAHPMRIAEEVGNWTF